MIIMSNSLQNKWIPRRDEGNPKTIEQIHKEAQKEEQERQVFIQQQQQQQKVQVGRGGPRGKWCKVLVIHYLITHFDYFNAKLVNLFTHL